MAETEAVPLSPMGRPLRSPKIPENAFDYVSKHQPTRMARLSQASTTAVVADASPSVPHKKPAPHSRADSDTVPSTESESERAKKRQKKGKESDNDPEDILDFTYNQLVSEEDCRRWLLRMLRGRDSCDFSEEDMAINELEFLWHGRPNKTPPPERDVSVPLERTDSFTIVPGGKLPSFKDKIKPQVPELSQGSQPGVGRPSPWIGAVSPVPGPAAAASLQARVTTRLRLAPSVPFRPKPLEDVPDGDPPRDSPNPEAEAPDVGPDHPGSPLGRGPSSSPPRDSPGVADRHSAHPPSPQPVPSSPEHIQPSEDDRLSSQSPPPRTHAARKSRQPVPVAQVETSDDDLPDPQNVRMSLDPEQPEEPPKRKGQRPRARQSPPTPVPGDGDDEESEFEDVPINVPIAGLLTMRQRSQRRWFGRAIPLVDRLRKMQKAPERRSAAEGCVGSWSAPEHVTRTLPVCSGAYAPPLSKPLAPERSAAFSSPFADCTPVIVDEDEDGGPIADGVEFDLIVIREWAAVNHELRPGQRPFKLHEEYRFNVKQVYTQLRNAIKTDAIGYVKTHYKLGPDCSPKQVREAVQKLLDDNFHSSTETLGPNEFKHVIIADTIAQTHFSMPGKSIGYRFAKHFKPMPRPTIALHCTIIYFLITTFSTGQQVQNASLDADIQRHWYKYFLDQLDSMAHPDGNPTRISNIQRRLFKQVYQVQTVRPGLPKPRRRAYETDSEDEEISDVELSDEVPSESAPVHSQRHQHDDNLLLSTVALIVKNDQLSSTEVASLLRMLTDTNKPRGQTGSGASAAAAYGGRFIGTNQSTDSEEEARRAGAIPSASTRSKMAAKHWGNEGEESDDEPPKKGKGKATNLASPMASETESAEGDGVEEREQEEEEGEEQEQEQEGAGGEGTGVGHEDQEGSEGVTDDGYDKVERSNSGEDERMHAAHGREGGQNQTRRFLTRSGELIDPSDGEFGDDDSESDGEGTGGARHTHVRPDEVDGDTTMGSVVHD